MQKVLRGSGKNASAGISGKFISFRKAIVVAYIDVDYADNEEALAWKTDRYDSDWTGGIVL